MNILPFVISGLGIGAVYALSGVGLVVLFRATGVLNFAFGAFGAMGAHCAWQLLEWKVTRRTETAPTALIQLGG